MRAGGSLVHTGGRGGAVLRAVLERLHHLLVRAHQLLTRPSHEHSIFSRFSDGHVGCLRLVQEVPDVLSIDLQKLDLNLVCAVGVAYLSPSDLLK